MFLEETENVMKHLFHEDPFIQFSVIFYRRFGVSKVWCHPKGVGGVVDRKGDSMDSLCQEDEKSPGIW